MHKQPLIPIALATLLGAAGSAQAQVQLYGTVDAAFGRLSAQPPGPPNAPIANSTGVHNGGVQTSYFGMRGAEDLGSGLRANFQLEAFFRVDTGMEGRFSPPGPPQDPLFSRSSWIGLQGPWGDLKLGNVSNPSWLSLIFSSAMGSNSLFSPAFRQQFNGSTRGNNPLDTALPNSVLYSTPNLGGMVASLAVQARELSPGGNNVLANAVYRSGPLLLTAAGARIRHAPPPDPAAALDASYYVVGASYDLKAVKLFGQYAQLKDDLARTTDKMPQLGLTVPVRSGEFQLAWARDRTTGAANRTRTTTSAGYIHNLSRRSSLYAMFANDDLSVGTATSYVVGMRHTF
jgi:predicted porin